MVEFAVTAPVLFLCFFAAFEFCRVAMIRHTADNAVYEGCRAAIVPGGTTDDARNAALQIMSSLGVNNVQVSVVPKQVTNQTEFIRVEISVPLDGNSFVPNRFVAGKSVVRELTMRREGVQ